MKNKYTEMILIILLLSLILTKDVVLSLADKTEIINEVYNLNLENVLSDYQALLKANNLKTVNNNYILSKVSYRNINDFWQYITINKGTKDNVLKKRAVVNNMGLVGIIDKVDNYSSRVMLITNSKINISVKINNSYGILTAKNNTLYLENVIGDVNVKIGDKVYTSGLTEIPENILVGTIKEINQDDLGLQKIFKLTPAVTLKNIDYVAILESGSR
ncbi:MAG: rod shape-determining protein MreC [Bacilli bacterium]|nr:rod shape-determining protein MreC [Bacilli bacterium]